VAGGGAGAAGRPRTAGRRPAAADDAVFQTWVGAFLQGLALSGGDEFHAFFTTGPVVAFRVDDFDETRRTMLAAGIVFIGDVQHSKGISWQHFRCPDGTVLEISGPGVEPPG
jgi:hypothetical protein